MPEPSNSFSFSNSATPEAKVAGVGISHPVQINCRSSPITVLKAEERKRIPAKNTLLMKITL